MTDRLNHLTAVILLGFAVVAGALGYWSVARAPDLLGRDDNPRLVEAERAIARGTIYDRAGRPLAVSTIDAAGFYTRSYPYPQAAPATGYYSIRYGVGGAEAAYDERLRGDFNDWDALLHRTRSGGDVHLTLDLTVQTAVAAEMAGRAGAVIVIDAKNGAVLAMVSSPTFDPNTLDEQWDDLAEDPAAPLLNRVTQGRYQPGGALETVVLAAALDRREPPPFDSADATKPVTLKLNGETITATCARTPDQPPDGLVEAYAYACPAPFVEAGEALRTAGLNAAFEDFGLLDPPFLLERPAVLATPTPTGETSSVAAASLGQAGLTVSPAQMVRVAAAVLNEGEIPQLHLASGMGAATAETVIRRTVVAQVQAAMRSAFETLAIEGDIIGHASRALSGMDDGALAWFIGGDVSHSLAVAVVLENGASALEAARIGRLALAAARDAE